MAFLMSCPCSCGSHVEASDGGFSGTSVNVEPCLHLAASGVVSTKVRKSYAYAAVVPAEALRHAAGLVEMGGAA